VSKENKKSTPQTTSKARSKSRTQREDGKIGTGGEGVRKTHPYLGLGAGPSKKRGKPEITFFFQGKDKTLFSRRDWGRLIVPGAHRSETATLGRTSRRPATKKSISPSRRRTNSESGGKHGAVRDRPRASKSPEEVLKRSAEKKKRGSPLGKRKRNFGAVTCQYTKLN